MNSVREIETALRRLAPEERWAIARRLLEDLEGNDPGPNDGKAPGNDGGPAHPLPDYSARRRRIFGSKVLPNMVLAGRAEERW